MMQLTMRLNKRWITSALREAAKPTPRMPWQRGAGKKPVPGPKTPVSLRIVQARA